MNPTKLSICGDIHLNLRSLAVGHQDWERERFLALFQILANNDSKTILLNGDIFDKAKPTFQEIGVFYEGIDILVTANKEVLVSDGNHEELSATSTTFDFLPHAGFRRIKADYLAFASTYIWIVGHPHISHISKDLLPIMYDKKNILISHYRSDIGYAEEEVDNGMVSGRFDDAVLSDIHYRLSPAHNIQYTSSPYGIHFTPDKDYGYCTITMDDNGYEIDFVKLDLPSKVKITTPSKDLEDTLTQLDKANRYNIEVTGSSTTEHLTEIAKHGSITKFNFSEQDMSDSFEEITDDIKAAGDNSISEIIMVALDDVELSPEELAKAKVILQETL